MATAELGGVRSQLNVPMLKDNELVGAIGIYRLQAREPFRHVDEQFLAAGTVGAIGGMNPQIQDQTERVDQQRAFAAFDLLGPVEAGRSPFSVLLTVWLSRMAALGLVSRPASVWTCSRRISCICCQAPS